MYSALIIALIIVAAAVAIRGVRKRHPWTVVGGVLIALATWAFFWLMGFWGEFLWFDALGQGERFWREILWALGSTVVGGLAAGLLGFLLTWSPRDRRGLRWAAVAIVVLMGLAWGYGNWRVVAMYACRASTDLSDPIFEKPVGFYLFVLPLYDAVRGLLVRIAGVSLVACLAGVYLRMEDGSFSIQVPPRETQASRAGWSLFLSAGVLLAALAWGSYLNRYHLLYSEWGAVTGAGWTDLHVRLPGYWITGVVTALLAVLIVIRPLRQKLLAAPMQRMLQRTGLDSGALRFAPIAAALAAAALVWLIVVGIAPGLMQWLRVEPNEITFEKPYIAHNIRFTRHGYRLHDAEEREFPATGQFTREQVEDNRGMFDSIRLWDYRALAQVYSQFQEIRLYYEFRDVDIDRYMLEDRYRQVMISARELELSNLPSASQTFVNRHFKYTHGNGVTLTTVSDFTPEGLPDLLIKDIPPVSTLESLKVDQPRIYYGELTRDYVVANSEEEEFDYPSGQENVYSHYDGTGGVLMKNFWRKFIYGWKLGGTRLLLSGYPTAESRIMFRRNIRDRVRALAPFLQLDRDPYITLIDGKLYWILDAYTVSARYPYSEPFDAGGMGDYVRRRSAAAQADEVRHLEGINYIRNSVKAVIDAYEGSVSLYVMDAEDPIIRTWQGIFPGLLKPRESMPAEMLRHIRYPADFLLVQGLVFAKYHMTDPEVFYNLEDLWVRATEKYYQSVQAVLPYYIMWKSPRTGELEYILMLPFTPKNKQVLIGWIAGMCDGDNYGRFLAYRFPKERRLLGPQQVETKIDQDPHLSGQLTLWDQRGSKVIRGNVLAIPVDETLLYVEPIYIRAETAAYPELRLVIVMHEDRLSYAETFDRALEGLFGAEPRVPGVATRPSEAVGKASSELIRQASEAFEDYLRWTGEKDFEKASESLRELQSALEELRQRAQSPAEEESAEAQGQ